MIKFLIFILLGYFAYRVFFEKPKLSQKTPDELRDGDYTDYEELD